MRGWEAQFPDTLPYASDIAERYVQLNDFDKASDWFERAYEHREFGFFRSVEWSGANAYHRTPRWIGLTQQPAFKEWQAAHDRVGTEIASHRVAG